MASGGLRGVSAWVTLGLGPWAVLWPYKIFEEWAGKMAEVFTLSKGT